MQQIQNWMKTNKQVANCTAQSSRVALNVRGISRLVSAVIFLQRFKLAHIYTQVTSLHKVGGFESISKFF